MCLRLVLSGGESERGKSSKLSFQFSSPGARLPPLSFRRRPFTGLEMTVEGKGVKWEYYISPSN